MMKTKMKMLDKEEEDFEIPHEIDFDTEKISADNEKGKLHYFGWKAN